MGGWGGSLCQVSVSRLANLSNDCQMICPVLLVFRSRIFRKIVQGLSEEAHCNQGAILNCASCSCPALSLAWEFLLLIGLLTFLSTNVPSLERSIDGSTYLGEVKIGQDYFLRYSLPDSLYCLFSGCLTYLECIMGIKDHHGQQPTCLLGSL